MDPQPPLRTDQRPLYARASDALRQWLGKGGFQPGDRLPSEIAMSHQLGISRPTLREALRQLEEEGAIVRRHGVGTFVSHARPVIEGGLELLESIESMAERLGLHTEMGECTAVQRAATSTEAKTLGLERAAQVTVVDRTIRAGNTPVAYLVDVVPVDFLTAAELGPEFEGSVLDLFLKRGSPTLSHSWTELAAEPADGDLARRLGVPRGAPLLRLQARLYAAGGQVLDYSTSHFVSEHFRFHVVRRIGQP